MGLIDTRTAIESIAMGIATRTGVAITAMTKVVVVRNGSGSKTCLGALDGTPHTAPPGCGSTVVLQHTDGALWRVVYSISRQSRLRTKLLKKWRAPVHARCPKAPRIYHVAPSGNPFSSPLLYGCPVASKVPSDLSAPDQMDSIAAVSVKNCQEPSQRCGCNRNVVHDALHLHESNAKGSGSEWATLRTL